MTVALDHLYGSALCAPRLVLSPMLFQCALGVSIRPAVSLFAAQMLCIQVDDILNDLLAIEQGIQEANKNFFVQVGSKQ